MTSTMRSIINAVSLGFIVLVSAGAQNQPAQPRVEQSEVLKNWSLFSEYQKNGDCNTAVPYGWNVVRMDPKRFKTLFTKMGECYYNFYEKETDAEKRKAYADTMVMLYELGIRHVPDRASTYWLSKAYALENYFEGKELDAIAAYEAAISIDPKIEFAYVDRLGVLYVKTASEVPENKQKAIELYRKVLEADPKNEVAGDRLKRLVSDPRELIEIAEKQLATAPNDIEKIWNAAQAYIQAEQYVGAEKYLQRLVKMSPQTSNYWNELGKVQQREQKFKQAIESYEKALSLNPALRENFLNITICHRELRNYSAARNYALRAAQRERGWGRPYMEIAEVYKASVEDCIRNSKGGDWSKLDINDKLVYKLAWDSYTRAKNVDGSLGNEAELRMRELSTLVPSREDYFFHRDKIKDGKIELDSPCYSWIGEPVPVPTLR
ncbi:MAG TPA: tetratricopeptide repeat protein [Bacteroidota bacterium]|nr:tetratricopeptide repeat protein [Bacteroidota bacterium]